MREVQKPFCTRQEEAVVTVSLAMSGEGPNQKWTVCPCNNCSEHLEFDSANEGETVQCPHCGMDTVLFIPQAEVELPPPAPPSQPPPKPEPKTAWGMFIQSKDSEKPPPKPEPKRAEIVEDTTYENAGVVGRLELEPRRAAESAKSVAEHLEAIGAVFLGVSILGGIVAAYAFLDYLYLVRDIYTQNSTQIWVVIGSAIGLGAVCLVIRLLFKAGAAIIRLLGCGFTGKITQYTSHLEHKCSVCGKSVSPKAKQCWGCGAQFVP
jgi:hypothetical protein